MALKGFFDLLLSLFGRKKTIRLGFYGPVNAGKCVTPETEVILQDGQIKQIKDIFDEVRDKLENFNYEEFNETYLDTRDLNIIVPSFNYQSLKITPKKVSFVYAQKYKGLIYNIKTRSGRLIRVTPEHPLIRISNNGIEKIKSSDLKKNDCIAISKKLTLNSEIKLPLISEGFNISSNGMIQSISKFHNPKQIKVPTYIDENLVSFIGYTITESLHGNNHIKFFNTDEYSLNHFKFLTKRLFDLDYIERINKGVQEVEVNSKTLTDYLKQVLDFKPATSKFKQIPQKMMGMSDNLTAVLLRTLFDMEGYFPNPNKHKGGSEIEFTSKSKKLVEQVQILLNRFGIVGRFKEKIINNQSYWRLLIGGSDNHRLFREKIGSNIKHKKENLNLLCQLSLKRNKFHLPIPHLLNNYREEIGMTQKQFFLDKKYFYDLKKRNRISYNKIEKMYESTHNEFLKIFAESDNIWDEIVSIEKEGYDGYVYDLTVEDNHTFILSNGLIAHNTSLANRISKDFTGEELGTVSRIPHETREIQVKEKVRIKKGKKSLDFNLIDTPGIATKIDFTDFLKHGLSPKESKERAKEATQGVIEAIKWLENVDCVLVVLDSTENPYNQVNITIIGNLAARKIPVLIVANKADLKKSRLKRIESTFPQYKVVPMSALTGKNIDLFYDELFKLVK